MNTQNNNDLVALNSATNEEYQGLHIGVSNRVAILFSIALFVFFILLGYLTHGLFHTFKFKFKLLDIPISFLLIFLIILFHEGLHCLGYLVNGVRLSQIKIKFSRKDLSLFCLSTKQIKLSAYRFVSIIPLLVTGVFPYVFSVIHLNYIYIFTFSISISICASDIIIFVKSFKHPKNTMVLDHPRLPGFIVK